tara:strand:+ start:251 stop:595 length:345 start_codon:yes stop_codon:yes gene_type:complete
MELIKKNYLHGCANITGGGLVSNIERIIPDNLSANLNLKTIKVNKIFKWLKNNNISEREMIKTFNCGIGFCLVIDSKNLKKIQNHFSKVYKPYVIGKIIKYNKKTKVNGKINWK